MSASREEILSAALELAESDRVILVNRLLGSLPENSPVLTVDDPDLADELDRRSGDWNGAMAWDELRDELRSDQ